MKNRSERLARRPTPPKPDFAVNEKGVAKKASVKTSSNDVVAGIIDGSINPGKGQFEAGLNNLGVRVENTRFHGTGFSTGVWYLKLSIRDPEKWASELGGNTLSPKQASAKRSLRLAAMKKLAGPGAQMLTSTSPVANPIGQAVMNTVMPGAGTGLAKAVEMVKDKIKIPCEVCKDINCPGCKKSTAKLIVADAELKTMFDKIMETIDAGHIEPAKASSLKETMRSALMNWLAEHRNVQAKRSLRLAALNKIGEEFNPPAQEISKSPLIASAKRAMRIDAMNKIGLDVGVPLNEGMKNLTGPTTDTAKAAEVVAPVMAKDELEVKDSDVVSRAKAKTTEFLEKQTAEHLKTVINNWTVNNESETAYDKSYGEWAIAEAKKIRDRKLEEALRGDMADMFPKRASRLAALKSIEA